MEIHTNKPKVEPEPEEAPTPEQNRYLRRKTTQKLRKSHFASRRLIGAMRIMAKLGACFLALAFLLSILVFAYSSDAFALRNITINGCKHLDADRLRAIIRDNFPSNLLQIDLKHLQGLLEDETWTKRVEIRRVLPSDLVIDIQERVPSVVLEMKGELVLADSDGVLLDSYNTEKYGRLDVPVFKGVLGRNAGEFRLYQEENSARIRLGQRLLSDLESGSQDHTKSISEVDLSDRNNVKVILVNDTAEIFLGNRDFLKRFATLMSNMNQYQDLKAQYTDIASVDLRFDGQIVYRPRRTAGGQPAPVAGTKP